MLVTVSYVAGYLFSLWYVTGVVAWNTRGYNKKHFKLPPGGDDYLFGLFVGIFGSLVWPVALLFAYCYQNSAGGAGKLFYTPKEVKMEMLQQRIKELEREVGIK
jgi:hypothetical protein